MLDFFVLVFNVVSEVTPNSEWFFSPGFAIEIYLKHKFLKILCCKDVLDTVFLMMTGLYVG